MSEPEPCGPVYDLMEALSETINNYMQGHDLTLATVVGILETIKFGLLFDTYKEDDE